MSRVKSKLVSSALDNEDLQSLFNDLSGLSGTPESLDLRVVFPKYQALRAESQRFIYTLNALRNNPHIEAQAGAQVSEYVARLQESHNLAFSAPDLAALHPPRGTDLLTESPVNYEGVTPDEAKAFGEAYLAVKDQWAVCAALNTCAVLREHKQSLGDEQRLSGAFLTHMSGQTFTPVHELPVNFYRLYISQEFSAADREFLLTVLHKLLVCGTNLYMKLTEPDIDVNRFSSVVLSSIDKIGVHVKGCGDAIRKIRESVSLFKQNFKDYYRDYAVSESGTSIIESFVMDVAKSVGDGPDTKQRGGKKRSASIAVQFKKIIMAYRRIAQQRQNQGGSVDRRLNAVFSQLDKHYSAFAQEDSKGASEAEVAAAEAAAAEAEERKARLDEMSPEEAAAERRRIANRRRKDRRRRQAARHQFDEAVSQQMSALPE